MKKLILVFFMSVYFIADGYAADLVPVSGFQLQQFFGTWYELARLPNSFEGQCSTPITVTYSPDPKNKNRILVITKCAVGENDFDIDNGTAYFVESTNIGKLKISFSPKALRWIPFSYLDYWVIYTDYTHLAVIGSKNHKYLWILVRDKNIDKATLEHGVAVAKRHGFDTVMLVFNYPDLINK